MAGALRKAMIDAIRSNRDRIAALEERLKTVYDRCEEAPISRPPCVAIGPRGGCLISPRHAVHAGHYPIRVGGTVKYEWGERTVTRIDLIGKTDIAIAVLDKPAECQPAKLLPWDWNVHLRVTRHGKQLKRPLRCLGQRANGEVVEVRLHSLGDHFGVSGPFAGGDSGQPIWLPLEEPVLVGCLLYAGSGPALHHYWREVGTAVWQESGDAVHEAEW